MEYGAANSTGSKHSMKQVQYKISPESSVSWLFVIEFYFCAMEGMRTYENCF